MKGTPVFINVHQLMIDRGRLQLSKPSELGQSSVERTGEIENFAGILLDEVKSNELMMTMPGSPHIRIRLTRASFQWVEKTDVQLNRYELKFSDGRILFNGNATDPSFARSFIEKIDKLIGAITEHRVTMYVKES